MIGGLTPCNVIPEEILTDHPKRYRAMLGVEPVLRERVEDQGVDEVLFAVGSSFIQLLGAIGPDSPVGRSLATRGPGTSPQPSRT